MPNHPIKTAVAAVVARAPEILTEGGPAEVSPGGTAAVARRFDRALGDAYRAVVDDLTRTGQLDLAFGDALTPVADLASGMVNQLAPILRGMGYQPDLRLLEQHLLQSFGRALGVTVQ